jgi:hypothetical protein
MCECELRSEKQGLFPCAVGQLAAADASDEAEVVADHRAGSGLSADGVGLQDKRPEALGCGEHRSGEASRAGADNDDVVLGT